ncbi:unnamed protein product [Anisakis simplex]|uniref:Uncharacterized protein n=1 Tax=Anisakis simplex TaxID=6269 RepID=A0A3P6SS79_ANISI|nr:unnamed protein product [Anisakis simplex]
MRLRKSVKKKKNSQRIMRNLVMNGVAHGDSLWRRKHVKKVKANRYEAPHSDHRNSDLKPAVENSESLSVFIPSISDC